MCALLRILLFLLLHQVTYLKALPGSLKFRAFTEKFRRGRDSLVANMLSINTLYQQQDCSPSALQYKIAPLF